MHEEARSRRFGRRQLLGGVGLTAGAVAVSQGPAAGAAGRAPITRDVEVVVIGAGLSGLAAARELVAHDLSCVILEARGRVGGRMVRQRVAGDGWIDLGGQWIGPTQHAILDLARALRVPHFDWYTTGASVLHYDGARSTFTGDFPPPPGTSPLPAGVTAADLVQAEELGQQLDRLSQTVDIVEPWKTPNAQDLDRHTISDWLDDHPWSAFARFSVATTILNEGGYDPDEASMLFLLLDYAQSPADEHPELWLFTGGAGQIPPLLAAELGDRIILNQPVRAIAQGASGVTVMTSNGRYRGKFAIVALPPYLAGAINYEPAMPAMRLQLTQRAPMGSVIKYACVYPTAWWRSKGLSGTTISDLPVLNTTDSSPPSGRPGILTSFLSGREGVAIGALPPAKRRAAVLANLESYFGPQVRHPTQFVEANWPAEPWTGGAYNGFFAPGVLTTYGPALQAPVGRIHWAGTEVATRWAGYFDGAVSAGQDAAAAVMRRR